MHDKIRECLAEAKRARELAEHTTFDARDKWLEIAKAWDELAGEHMRLAGIDEIETSETTRSH
jgi:hypothetical protein